jgi:hypothetical protein
VWVCLAKVIQTEPKKKKIGFNTSDCMFIGYVEHSVAYCFLILKSDVLDSNTIIETKNVEFFGHIFPLSDKSSHVFVNRVVEDSSEELRSKKPRK